MLFEVFGIFLGMPLPLSYFHSFCLYLAFSPYLACQIVSYIILFILCCFILFGFDESCPKAPVMCSGKCTLRSVVNRYIAPSYDMICLEAVKLVTVGGQAIAIYN